MLRQAVVCTDMRLVKITDFGRPGPLLARLLSVAGGGWLWRALTYKRHKTTLWPSRATTCRLLSLTGGGWLWRALNFGISENTYHDAGSNFLLRLLQI